LGRTRQDVGERCLIDAALLRSSEARRLDTDGEKLGEVYERPGTLAARDKIYPITGPVSLVDAVMELGRRDIDVQRYKGLGEMNPEQLWETSLDPEVRSLLQVRISHADSAEETFSTLMGDLVEPRRDFIQANALSVANLDVSAIGRPPEYNKNPIFAPNQGGVGAELPAISSACGHIWLRQISGIFRWTDVAGYGVFTGWSGWRVCRWRGRWEADEFLAGDAAGRRLGAFALLVSDRRDLLVATDDAGVGYGDTKDVAGEAVEHGWLALAP
jgi:hypothetical protein